MPESPGRFLRPVFTCLLLVLVVPAVVFILTGFLKGMAFTDVLDIMATRFGEARPNLLVTSLIGVFPLSLLGLVIWIHRKRGGSQAVRSSMLAGGMLALLLVIAWSNYEYWRVFLPEGKVPGFPHGLELLIGPVFFAPVAMALALIAAWAIARPRRE